MFDSLIRWVADPFGAETRRIRRVCARPVPPEWRTVLDDLPFYRRLSAPDRSKLDGLVHLFRHRVSFEGCGGLELTDEIIISISAHAALLVLNRPLPPYPTLKSLLGYPESYVAKYLSPDGPRRVTKDTAVMLGTSWTSGTVILAWSAVEGGYRNPHDGHNVALHEFAHQLDQEDGPVDGAPNLRPGQPRSQRIAAYREWQTVMEREYRELCEAVERRKKTVLDPYAATMPAEFFAVATEAFFERADTLKRKHPDLYTQLQLYYRQDPAVWSK